MASNHHALYTRTLEYGVGDVVCCMSRKVPTAMATAKTINKTPVSLVEKRIEASFFCMSKIIEVMVGKITEFNKENRLLLKVFLLKLSILAE